MEARDVRGILIEPGDLVCAGYDNGSSLYIATVNKVTLKKVFCEETQGKKADRRAGRTIVRDHNRIAVLEKKKVTGM